MQGIQAREQLAEGKGLGQIVVAAAAQAANAVIDLGQRAQDQDRSALAGLAQHLDDRQTVDVAGQHAIHDDHIVGLARGEKHAVAPVGGVVGRMPRLLQALDDELADPLVVLDQQDLHVRLSERRTAVGRRDRGSSAGALACFCRRRRFSQQTELDPGTGRPPGS